MGAMVSQINLLFMHRSKKTPKLRVPGFCAVTSEFPAQMVSNAEMFPFDDVIMGLRVFIIVINNKGDIKTSYYLPNILEHFVERWYFSYIEIRLNTIL